jgi:hypothetical protein
VFLQFSFEILIKGAPGDCISITPPSILFWDLRFGRWWRSCLPRRLFLQFSFEIFCLIYLLDICTLLATLLGLQFSFEIFFRIEENTWRAIQENVPSILFWDLPRVTELLNNIPRGQPFNSLLRSSAYPRLSIEVHREDAVPSILFWDPPAPGVVTKCKNRRPSILFWDPLLRSLKTGAEAWFVSFNSLLRSSSLTPRVSTLATWSLQFSFEILIEGASRAWPLRGC